MTDTSIEQGGAAGAASAPAQGLPPDAQEAIAMAAKMQAEMQAQVAQLQAQAAAQGAAAAAQGAPGEAAVTIPGEEGVIVIRDKATGEEVVIQRDAIPPWLRDGPPEGVFMVPIALFASIAFVIVGLPIARAFGRRMDARNAVAPTVAPSAELRQLQTSIDTMAVEIERMSEHQRFLTRVLAEGRPAESLPARDASSAVPR